MALDQGLIVVTIFSTVPPNGRHVQCRASWITHSHTCTYSHMRLLTVHRLLSTH